MQGWLLAKPNHLMTNPVDSVLMKADGSNVQGVSLIDNIVRAAGDISSSAAWLATC